MKKPPVPGGMSHHRRSIAPLKGKGAPSILRQPSECKLMPPEKLAQFGDRVGEGASAWGLLQVGWWRAPDCWLSPGPSSLVPQRPSRDVAPYSRCPVRPAFWLSFSRSFAWSISGPARADLTPPDQSVARPVRPLQRAAVPRLFQGLCGPLKPPPRPRKRPSEKPQWRAREVRPRSLNGGRSEPLLAWRPAAAQAARRRRCQPCERLSLHRQRSRSGRKGKGSLEARRQLPRQPRKPLLEQGQEWCASITYARYQLCAPQRVHSKAKKKVRIKAGSNTNDSQAISAYAADLPRRAPPPAYVPPVPIFTWTGFYIGANVGGAFRANNRGPLEDAGARAGRFAAST